MTPDQVKAEKPAREPPPRKPKRPRSPNKPSQPQRPPPPFAVDAADVVPVPVVSVSLPVAGDAVVNSVPVGLGLIGGALSPVGSALVPIVGLTVIVGD